MEGSAWSGSWQRELSAMACSSCSSSRSSSGGSSSSQGTHLGAELLRRLVVVGVVGIVAADRAG